MFVEFEQLLTPMNDRFEGASNHNSDGGRSVDSKKSTNSSKNMYIMSKKQLNIPTSKKVKASPKESPALNSTLMLRSSLIGNFLMNAYQKQ